MAGGYRDNYNPAPGPQQPDKYPAPVGSNYQQFGEQQGYVYDPYQDTYFPDPRASQDYYTETGLQEKEEKPGMSDVLGPIAAGAGAIAAGQFIGNPSNWGHVKDGASSLFSMGAPDAPAAVVPSVAPSAVSGSSVPFSMGSQAAPGADFSTPFSWGSSGPEAISGSAPSTPNVISATTMAPSAGNTFGVAGGLMPVLGVAGQAYYHYDQLKTAYDEMNSGRTSGQGAVRAAMMSNPLTAWAAPFVDKFGIKSGKHADQYRRDAVRDHMRERGILDEEYNITNADGSKFSFGLDGGARLEGGHLDGKRQQFDINLEDPNAVALIPIADTFAAILSGGDKKLTSDVAGYVINGATSSGDPRANLEAYLRNAGLDHDTAYGQIHLMSQPQKDGDGNESKPLLDKETADAYKNSLDQFFGVGAYAGGAKPTGGGGPAPAPSVAAPKPAPVAPPPVKPPMQTTTAAPKPQAAVAPAPRPAPAAPQPQKPMNTAAKPVRGNIFQRK